MQALREVLHPSSPTSAGKSFASRKSASVVDCAAIVWMLVLTWMFLIKISPCPGYRCRMKHRRSRRVATFHQLAATMARRSRWLSIRQTGAKVLPQSMPYRTFHPVATTLPLNRPPVLTLSIHRKPMMLCPVGTSSGDRSSNALSAAGCYFHRYRRRLATRRRRARLREFQARL